MPASSDFYARLPVHSLSPNELLADEQHFLPVPDDWHVVLTDIKGSTQQVQAGRHEEINLIATGSIIASLNIAYEAGTEVPFFFGGDGATLLIPDDLLKPVMLALVEHRDNTGLNFEMELRVGSVPVSEVYAHNERIQIAKMRLGAAFSIPVVLGQGLSFAEKIIKGKDFHAELSPPDAASLNLEGMECRWDRIQPPGDTSEVVCLLVNACGDAAPASVYKKVLDQIDAVYGPQQSRNPISTQRLQLANGPGKIILEMRARLGRFSLGYLIKNWLITLFGKWYFRFWHAGKTYLQTLVELSDTLVIDGRINTVISGTVQQRQALIRALEPLEVAGEIVFGYHVSRESVMSCYVRNRDNKHIHFIDGSEGGYTQAAVMLKQKLRSRNQEAGS